MRTIVTATLLAIAATPVVAMDSHIVGPRALGMGGAGTAATDDNTASYWNPGMYGFFHRRNEDGTTLANDPNDVGRRTWGIGFADAVVGYEIKGRLADNVQQLSDSNLSKLSGLNASTATAKDLQTAVTALTLLQRFDAGHDTVALDANAGVMGIRIGHFGIGFRQFAQGFVSISDKDLTNIGIAVSGGLNVLDAINTPSATPTGWTSGFSNLIPVGSQTYTDLTAALSAVTGGSTSVSDAISKLDYAATQGGLTEADLAAIGTGSGSLINAINNISTDVNQNVTSVFTGGFTVAELPITYGYALNDQFSVGVNAKLMIGKVAAAKARLISGTDKIPTLLQDAFDKSEQTVTGGVDVGIVWRNSWMQAGLTGRNLNRPILKGGTFTDADGFAFSVADVPLDPQATFGLALYPFQTLCLTGDIDLTENKSVIKTTSGRPGLPIGTDPTLKIENVTRRASAGVEWNIGRVLALRGGVSKNIAESESSAMVHAGFGINFWLLRADLAASMSTDKVTVDGKEYPKAANVGFGITMDF